MGAIDKNDPFAVFLTPPPNETQEERILREKKDAEAQRESDRIDDEIRMEKAAAKKQQGGLVKVLLLGQSESGKSTTLKNFRMRYASADWKQERASWKAVIQLNLIRSVFIILDTLEAEMINEPITAPDDFNVSTDALLRSSLDTIMRTSIDNPADNEPIKKLPIDLQKHQLLKLRLSPLQPVEADLKRRLGAGTEDIGPANTGVLSDHTMTLDRRREFGVRAWKDALGNFVRHRNTTEEKKGEWHRELHDEATEVIASCREDVKALWMDETVRAVLEKRRMRVEDSAGFFLNDLDRIATRTYEPSDDDIIRARLRTVGVQEYRIKFGPEPGSHILGNVGGTSVFGNEWIIYDVGGSRTLRHAWLPYFEGVNAIIFLAPISCFDERLLEDPAVNRLEDSFLLWRAVCSSKLLSKATVILFLNKFDILHRKLQSGVQVRMFLPSYGDRPNDTPTVTKYLKQKFRDILRQNSPAPRNKYFYTTSVTDTKATAVTLNTVRDSILREHLKTAEFL